MWSTRFSRPFVTVNPTTSKRTARSVGEQQYRIHYYTVGEDVIWGLTEAPSIGVIPDR